MRVEGRAMDEALAMANMLSEARAIRAAFPNVAAMQELPVSPLPPKTGENAEYRTALGYLRDEMLVVRDGRAKDLGVLDDEIACVEGLSPQQ